MVKPVKQPAKRKPTGLPAVCGCRFAKSNDAILQSGEENDENYLHRSDDGEGDAARSLRDDRGNR
jgi:hypothetical protein